MVAAGLLAKKAVEKGLTVPPWVKTSLAPGSRVVTDYYNKAGLLPYLDKLRFNVVGYGCTTCIGNSGPLPTDVSKSHRRPRPRRRQRALRQSQLRGPRQRRRPRQLPHVARRSSSPTRSPATSATTSTPTRSATIQAGKPVYLKDIWPTQAEVADAIEKGLIAAKASARSTPPSPTATPAGRASTSPPATSTGGSPTPPTSARRPTSTA